MRLPTLLLVEDNPDLRDIMARLLKRAGYDAVSAADGREALQVFDNQHPDLILLDLHMPDVDGFTFLKELREHHDTAGNVPVIVLSAASDADSMTRARELGAREYLVKARTGFGEMLTCIAESLATASLVSEDDDRPVVNNAAAGRNGASRFH